MTPDDHTISQLHLPVNSGHKLYVQIWGNVNAEKTFIYLHGGPGQGSSDSQKNYFNPKKHKIIFFDQRGSGQSTPYGSLKNNNTQELIKDIDKIAEKFNLNNFTLVGGSWGSCLALAYAISNPNKVKRLIIRGVLTASKLEQVYLYKGLFKYQFPEAWSDFISEIPKNRQEDPFIYIFSKILGPNKKVAKKYAYIFSKLENSLLKLDDRIKIEEYKDFDPTPTIIESHYLKNNFFLEEDFILKNAHKLKMPIEIIQGRYDSICPPIAAYNLHKKLPNSKYYSTIAGHSGSDRPNWDLFKVLIEN